MNSLYRIIKKVNDHKIPTIGISRSRNPACWQLGATWKLPVWKLAYRSGIFPWPHREGEILWFAPPQRGILEFADLHIPRRLQRHLKKTPFTFRMNSNFEAVIHHCAASKNRGKGQGTWITRQMLNAYISFHAAGFAQSFEAYNENGKLVGGMYGVRIDNYFAGESMFYFETNASKFVLFKAIEHFKEKWSHLDGYPNGNAAPEKIWCQRN